MAEHPSLLRLARFADGTSPEADQLRDHLASCPRCQAELAALEGDVRRFRAVEGRQRARVFASSHGYRPLLAAVALLVIAGLVTYWQWPVGLPAPEGPIAVVRAKGAFASEIVLQRGDAPSIRVAPGATVASGDRLAVEATAVEAGHLAAFAVDERGAVTHLGSSPRSAPIGPGAPLLVPGSYRLDDSPTTEFVVVCFAAAPFTLDTAFDGLAAAPRPLTAAAIEAAVSTTVGLDVIVHTLPRAGR